MTTLSINSTPLDDKAGRWRLEASTSLPTLSLPENEIISLPFVDDQLAIAGPVTARPYAITLWIPNPTRPSFDAIGDTLAILAPVLHAARTLTLHPNTGPARSARILNLTASRPEPVPSREGARLALDLTLAPYWTETGSPKTKMTPLINGIQTIPLPEWDGTSGPLTDAIIAITGPASSLTITNPANATSLTIATALAAGQSFTVDLAAHSVKRAGAVIGYDFGPAGFLELAPSPSTGTLSITVAAAGTTSASKLTLSARRSFL